MTFYRKTLCLLRIAWRMAVAIPVLILLALIPQPREPIYYEEFEDE